MLNRVARIFAAQIVSLALSIGDRIVLVAVLLRAWGTPLYADWAQLMATATLLTLGEFGINIYFGNAWQAAFARKEEGAFARALGVAVTAYGALLTLLATFAAGCLLVADPVRALGLRSIDPATARAVLTLLAAVMVLRVGRGLLSQIYRGRGEMARGLLIDCLISAVTIAGAVSVAFLGYGPLAVAAAYLLAEAVAGWLVTIADIKRRYPKLGFAPVLPTRSEFRDFLAQMRWLAILQNTPILWQSVPVLLLGVLAASANEIVAFVMMRTLVNFARQVVAMFSLATGVELASALHSGNRDAVSRNLGTLGILNSVMTTILCCGVFVFIGPILELWSGRSGLAVSSVVLWLSASVLAAAPGISLSALAVYGGTPSAVALTNMVQLVVGLVLGYCGGTLFGLTGLAAGLAIGEIVAQLVVLPAAAGPIAGLNWPQHVAVSLARAASAGCVALAAGAIISQAFEPRTMMQLIIAGAGWGLLGALPALLIGLDQRSRGVLVAALRRRSAPA